MSTDSTAPGSEVRIALAPPPLWTPTVAVLVVGFGACALLAAGAVYLADARTGSVPARLWEVLALSAAVSLGTAIAWGLFRPRRMPPIEVSDELLSLPRTRMSRRATRLPIERVYSLQVMGRRSLRRVVIGAVGRLPINVRVTDFAEPDGPERLEAALWGALARRPNRAVLLAGLERRRRVADRVRRGVPWATLVLLALVAGGFAAELRRDALHFPARLVELGANGAPLVRRGEWYRLVTANFLHAGIWHVYLNGFCLLLLGLVIERLLGATWLALLFLASALAGSAASALLAGSLLSVGASTGIAGLVACLAWINFRYRDDLPAPLRIAGWWWAVTAALGLLFELVVPNLDHAGHLGGALAGLAVVAWGSRATPLLELRRAHAGVLVASLALGVVFAAGLARGVQGARRADPERALDRAESFLDASPAAPQLTNDLLWDLLARPELPRDVLERANRTLASVLELRPDEPAFRDTAATAAWRLGETRRAIDLERRALAQREERFYASQLARFEWALRQQTGGPLRVGDAGAVSAHVELVPAAEGQPGPVPRVLLGARLERPVELHAVGLREGRLVGHLRATLPAGWGPVGRLAPEAPLAPEWRTGVRFQVVLIDADPPAAIGAPAFVAWTLDPEVAALP